MTTADEIAAEQYRFGDVSVDCSNFRVVRNGEVVPLRPRDFDVLVYLLRNTGRVVEKQELFESVWGDTFVSDNALTKIIKEIRLVLGDRADNPIYIETVPKRGYRFIGKIEYLGSAGPDAESSEDKTRSEVQRVSELAGASWRSFPGADRRLVAAIGLVASVAFAAWIWTRAASEPPSDAIQSIAVMPFINQSADPDVEYLADGITESLVAALSRVPRLSVKSRSSVFRYKGKDVSPGVVGRELGVRTIVSGRVVQRGAEVVMYVELIETATGNVMWKSNFTRPMRDLLSVEREIARNLSQQLSTKLSSADEQDVSNTRVPEAYQDYLRGRFHWNKRTVADFRKSLEYFQRAIDADP
ncbi:MAG: winged helix-turn-helix domain-containing protein, partial [Pyrinomonadaceae bacterium]